MSLVRKNVDIKDKCFVPTRARPARTPEKRVARFKNGSFKTGRPVLKWPEVVNRAI